MKIEDIACVCHEVNRAYCDKNGEAGQVPWEEAPEWQRESAIAGVQFHLDRPDSTPADSHIEWMRHKREDGWKYGPHKDPSKKEHPCMVDHESLPDAQQMKDHLFLAVIRSLESLASTEEIAS